MDNKFKKITAICGAAAALGCSMALGACTVQSDDVTEYREWKAMRSSLQAFPETLDGLNVNEYFVVTDHPIFGTPGREIFLDVTYGEDEFVAEVNRLATLEYRPHGKTQSLKFDDGVLFNYPTYVAIYNHGGDYEYACVDANGNRIIYAYMQIREFSQLQTDGAYLPKNYAANESEDTADGYGFSIYVYPYLDNWY